MIETKGKNFHKMLKNKLLNNGLDLKNCIGNSTDGASNMQGQNNGFSAWFSKSSPGQIHVWCYSHILNLVMDFTKSALSAVKLFSLLNKISVFYKETYKRINILNTTVGENIKTKIVSIGMMTRWWSKEKSLQTIFGEDTLYIQLIVLLNTTHNSSDFNPETRAKAKNLKEAFISYELILTTLVYIHIFKIAGPLSRYLQTSGIDLINKPL